MFGFDRSKRKRAKQLLAQEETIKAVVDEVQAAANELPGLVSLTLHGEGNLELEVLHIHGIAEYEDIGEIKVRKLPDKDWDVRMPDLRIYSHESLVGALNAAFADMPGQVTLGKLTDSNFIPERYDTMSQAEERLEYLRTLDPEGVSNGEYYIDSPEHKVLSGD